MWLARLFRGWKVTQEDEPARFAPQVTSIKPSQPVKRTPVTGGNTPAKVTSGFDPYNSGTFERANAWERVTRR